MKQPEDTVTTDWVGGETGNTGGRMAERRRRGAYAGAVKLGCVNHSNRARTGKSQAEFAALCGISERTLRTWEAGREVSQATDRAICAKLAQLDALRAPRRPVKFRDSYTGETWSGRGLMPRWLRARMEQGRRLAEFAG